MMMVQFWVGQKAWVGPCLIPARAPDPWCHRESVRDGAPTTLPLSLAVTVQGTNEKCGLPLPHYRQFGGITKTKNFYSTSTAARRSKASNTLSNTTANEASSPAPVSTIHEDPKAAVATPSLGGPLHHHHYHHFGVGWLC